MRRLRPLTTLAVLAFVGGFADLARGGMTISAGLLVLAYVALIPAAMLRER